MPAVSFHRYRFSTRTNSSKRSSDVKDKPLKATNHSVMFCKRSPVIWATNHLGDRQVGDKPTYILVNWATEVEITEPELWKCERLTIAVLEQLCAVLGQRPFNITHQTNLPHSSLESYEVVGLIDASQCSVNQTAQVVSQPISDFLPTISRYFNNDPLPKTINNRLLWRDCFGIW